MIGLGALALLVPSHSSVVLTFTQHHSQAQLNNLASEGFMLPAVGRYPAASACLAVPYKGGDYKSINSEFGGSFRHPKSIAGTDVSGIEWWTELGAMPVRTPTTATFTTTTTTTTPNTPGITNINNTTNS